MFTNLQVESISGKANWKMVWLFKGKKIGQKLGKNWAKKLGKKLDEKLGKKLDEKNWAKN